MNQIWHDKKNEKKLIKLINDNIFLNFSKDKMFFKTRERKEREK